MGFFFEARSNSKVSLIKTKCDTYHGKNNCGNNGYWLLWAKVSLTYSGLKVLEIIITEANFFFLYGFSFMWVFFHEHWAIPEIKLEWVEDMEFHEVLNK